MKEIVVNTNGMVGVIETRPNRVRPQKLELDCNVGVYAVECKEAKSVYIGQSKNIPSRLRNHLMNLRKDHYKSTYPQWQKDWHTFGEIEFRFEAIQNCTVFELLDLETLWIKKYVQDGWFLYNQTLVTNDVDFVSCPSAYSDTLKKLVRLIDSGKISVQQIEQAINSF